MAAVNDQIPLLHPVLHAVGCHYPCSLDDEIYFLVIAVTVQTGYMPIGNLTGMTDAERASVASWYAKLEQ